MDIEQFKEKFLEEYKDVMQRMAIQPECEYRIFVYERSNDFIALIDNDVTRYETALFINDAIDQLKKKYPEIKEETGVRYFPLDRTCY